MTTPIHTPGPWEWLLMGDLRPLLGTPDRGRLIVMDFCRLGMQAAEPRFAVWPGQMDGAPRERLGGTMRRASELVHADKHPDARLIAAAPDLTAALQGLGVHPEYGYCFCLNRQQQEAGHTGECREARDALRKAGLLT
jgi:hypothetical protein